MDKKTIVISFAALFVVAALVSCYNESIIKKDTSNKTTTTIKRTTTKVTKKEDENIMDGVTLNYQSSIRIEKNNKVIYFDPYKIENSNNDADYIFITHSHYDHFSTNDIVKIKNDNTKFIITSDIKDKVQELGVKEENILVVYPNNNYKIGSLSFDAVAAYNTNKSYHKKSYNWVGYNVDIDGTYYYTVGDSDVTEELGKVSCDVIFIPVGGTYTMTDVEAADVVNNIKPKIAVPVHYGEVGSKSNAEVFVSKLDKKIKGVILK